MIIGLNRNHCRLLGDTVYSFNLFLTTTSRSTISLVVYQLYTIRFVLIRHYINLVRFFLKIVFIPIMTVANCNVTTKSIKWNFHPFDVFVSLAQSIDYIMAKVVSSRRSCPRRIHIHDPLEIQLGRADIPDDTTLAMIIIIYKWCLCVHHVNQSSSTHIDHTFDIHA